jgi:hypothetical protein
MYSASTPKARRMKTYHIAAQSGAGHGREIRRPSVVLAAPYDSHTPQLACPSAGQSRVVLLSNGAITFVKFVQHRRNQALRLCQDAFSQGRHIVRGVGGHRSK